MKYGWNYGVRLWDMIYPGWDTICNAEMCDDLNFRFTLLEASPNHSAGWVYGAMGTWNGIHYLSSSLLSNQVMMLLFFCGSYQSHASTWHNSLLPPAPSRILDSPSLHRFSDFLIPILGGHPQNKTGHMCPVVWRTSCGSLVTTPCRQAKYYWTATHVMGVLHTESVWTDPVSDSSEMSPFQLDFPSSVEIHCALPWSGVHH